LEPRIAGCDYFSTVQMSDFERVRSEFRGSGIDIGPSGEFAAELSGGIRGVEDSVRRFDELARLLASWPVCPRSEYRKTPEGWYRYCAEHVAKEETDLRGHSWPAEAADGSPVTDGPCTRLPKPLWR
jgi:hypothetical protein